MHRTINHATALLLTFSLFSLLSADNEKILLFKDANPYDGHLSAIKAGVAMMREFGAANKFTVDTTVNLSSFNSANLAKYDAVVFMHPYRVGELNDTMNASQDSAFQSFMLSGKGLVGIHCADRLNNNSPWYLNLLGVQYKNDIGPQNCTFHVANTGNPMTAGIPQTFTNSQQVRCNTLFFSDTSRDFAVLIKADQKDYPSDQKQAFYPYVWTHDYKGARVWCGSMGHTPVTFTSDTIWRKLILRGILYALNRPDYTKCIDPIPDPAFRNIEEWTIGGGTLRIFNCAGRTIGCLPLHSIKQRWYFLGNRRLPLGTYIIVTSGNKGRLVARRQGVE